MLRQRTLFTLAIVLSLSLANANAQTATASMAGLVKDPSGAVVVGAQVVLTNADTNVAKTTSTNSSGNYVILNIVPGNYLLQASKAGFRTENIGAFTLAVNQAATVNISLVPGAVSQSVQVQGSSVGQINTSTAELGSVISQKQIVDLPLNGRNFTELLLLTPGASPANPSQSSSGFTTAGIGDFSFPSINGQSNRSNVFIVDGAYDDGFLGTPVLFPIVDTIQEFKIQSQNDLAEFGGGLGGTVNIVTKSGTNQFHGDGWWFVRNNDFDARNYFVPTVTPYHQSQFGVDAGGPILKNRAFFYGAYQGYHFSTPQNTLYGVPTTAELNGDLSAIPQQIYNPFTTRPDPENPGQYIRDPFPGNQIPTALLNQGMLAYLKATVPAPNYTGPGGYNAIDTTPYLQTNTEYSIRADYALSKRDQVWFRWSNGYSAVTGSGGRQTLSSVQSVPSRNLGANWVHVFGATGTLTAHLGHMVGGININDRFRPSAVPDKATLAQQMGLAQSACCSFTGGTPILLPELNVPGYFSGGESVSNNLLADIWQYGASYSKLIGRHTLGFGIDLQSFPHYLTNSDSYVVGFTAYESGNPENPGNTGSALASYLLSVPNNADFSNLPNTMRWGGVLGYYGQDQWKVTQNLSINYGIRYDRTYLPGFGTFKTGNIYTGNLDLSPGQGTYILQAVPPSCAQTGAAPCIPTPDGTLPAHVTVTPREKALYDWTDNIQPRVGFAYRLDSKTAIRGGFGIAFDSWAGVIEATESLGGLWPSVSALAASNLNAPTPTQPTPSVMAQDAVPTGILPAATPFNQTCDCDDPHLKNAYSLQEHFGIERQLTPSTLLTLNYVGSATRRSPIGVPYNTATTPGPGAIQDRQPFPYIVPTNYTRSVGTGNYNALQATVEKRYSSGLALMASYTWSKTISVGCDGWFGLEGCSVQNVYDLSLDRSASALDIRHLFTASVVYALPFGPGKTFNPQNKVASYIIGNWQANAIASINSGAPFSVVVDGDIANTGNYGPYGYYERLNVVGNPSLQNKTPQEWFNTAAFAAPAPFTFGDSGRNSLRAPGSQNYDISVFRQFPFSIREPMNLEFRAEAFNAFNHTQFGAPGDDISDPSTFGVISSAAAARELQLALKLHF